MVVFDDLGLVSETGFASNSRQSAEQGWETERALCAYRKECAHSDQPTPSHTEDVQEILRIDG